jgi:hypothetical protein
LRNIVSEVRSLAADGGFDAPPFDIYWPGDFTHPQDHANVPARQVYLTDRSRASTHDFIILLCGKPSYGVGQENEIATQAGIPAIRLVPPTGISRMMAGSFVRAIDIKYEGELGGRIKLPKAELLKALQDIRRIYFRHRAFYRGISSDAFGHRLKRLIADRCGGDTVQCADDLGISQDYLHTLINEPFSVANPSARLLARMASRLCTHVGYLLGESEETDPIWVASNASWRQWVDENTGVDAATALKMRDTWRDQYRGALRTRDVSVASFRNSPKLMEPKDWDQQYQALVKALSGPSPVQRKIF